MVITYVQQTITSDIKFDSFLNDSVISSIFLQPITSREIIEIVSKMKNDTSPGFDSISIKVVKRIIPIISDILCKLFNCSMSTGIVPDQMKITRVTPIYKKGDVN